jgi:hypothetical protein
MQTTSRLACEFCSALIVGSAVCAVSCDYSQRSIRRPSACDPHELSIASPMSAQERNMTCAAVLWRILAQARLVVPSWGARWLGLLWAIPVSAECEGMAAGVIWGWSSPFARAGEMQMSVKVFANCCPEPADLLRLIAFSRIGRLLGWLGGRGGKLR